MMAVCTHMHILRACAYASSAALWCSAAVVDSSAEFLPISTSVYSVTQAITIVRPSQIVMQCSWLVSIAFAPRTGVLDWRDGSIHG